MVRRASVEGRWALEAVTQETACRIIKRTQRDQSARASARARFLRLGPRNSEPRSSARSLRHRLPPGCYHVCQAMHRYQDAQSCIRVIFGTYLANLIVAQRSSFTPHRSARPSRYQTKTVNIALQVLRAILPSSQMAGDPTSLRMALRVMLPHITDSPALVEF